MKHHTVLCSYSASVISMLENLSSKVTADGTAEAAEYDKFACFCKKTVDDKNYDIEQGT